MMDVMCSAPQWLHHFHDQDLDGIQTAECNKKHNPLSIDHPVPKCIIFSVQAFYFLSRQIRIFMWACNVNLLNRFVPQSVTLAFSKFVCLFLLHTQVRQQRRRKTSAAFYLSCVRYIVVL